MVGYTNARSVRGKVAEISDFCQTHQLDVMAICETWFNSEIRDSEVAIQGMTIYRTDRIGRLGGGTVLYVSDSLHSFPTRDPVLNSLPESSWVTVRVTERDLLLGVIYRPTSSTEHFKSTLIGVIEHLDRYQHMQIVIMDDFNVSGSNLNLSAPGVNTFA